MTHAISRDVEDRVVDSFKELHRHPEIAFEEHATAELVAQRLRDLGASVRTGVAGTGVIGTFQGERSGPNLVVRAELDALPVEEQTDLDFTSECTGKMHACGHDAHMAMALGVAELVAGTAGLAGAVHFLFQPAEEIGLGAQRMLDEGAFDELQPDAVLAVHTHAHLPTATIGICRGSATMGVAKLHVRISGDGGHGAFPHTANDPILPAAQCVVALQGVRPRTVPPGEPCVLTVCHIEAGNSFNTIPAIAELTGTVRAVSSERLELIGTRARSVIEGVAAAFGCQVEIDYEVAAPPVVNDDQLGELVRSVGVELLGQNRIIEPSPVPASDDLGHMSALVPTCYFYVGLAPAQGPHHPHHAPTFRVPEEAIRAAFPVLAGAVSRYLGLERLG